MKLLGVNVEIAKVDLYIVLCYSYAIRCY